jgi:hypothetical protein
MNLSLCESWLKLKCQKGMELSSKASDSHDERAPYKVSEIIRCCERPQSLRCVSLPDATSIAFKGIQTAVPFQFIVSICNY